MRCRGPVISGIVLLFGAMALLGAQTGSRGPSSAPFTIEPLTSPAGANSEAPQLTVEGDRAILSWLESHGEHAMLKFAERTVSGWSEVRTVVSGGDLMVNSADVPSVRALPGGSLVAEWLQKGSDPEGYALRLSWSADAGRTWSPAVSPHRDNPNAQHGFASLFPMAAGGFGLVWLDGQETVGMTLRSAEYGADHVKRRELSVDDRVCECCPTSSALTSDGPIVVYRDRSTEEIRDTAVSRLTAAGWSAPAPVHRDGWKITGCPVNGPSVSARGADVAVGWFTVQGGEGRAFVAFSSDAGRTFGQPIRVNDAVAIGRLQIGVLKDRSAAVSWIESMKSGSQLRVRRIERSGTRSDAVPVAGGLSSTHPRMVFERDELLFAWTELTQGSTRVRTARSSVVR